MTLSLALLQGDVTLHHERLLALLQERTRHVLVPELWPADESAGERTVRALLELRAFVADALTTNAAANAERIAGVVRVEVQRLVAQIGTETQAATVAQTAALERTGALLNEGLRRATETAAHELRDAASSSRDTMTAAATAARDAVATAATAARDSVELAATASREVLGATAKASRDLVELAATASREVLGATAKASRDSVELAHGVARRLHDSGSRRRARRWRRPSRRSPPTTARTSASISASTEAAVASLGELRGSLSAQLDSSSRALATAAAELHGTVGALSLTLADLAPQLGALAAEIALLAARADSHEQPNAVLDELVRLGEDVERLLASSQPRGGTTEVAGARLAGRRRRAPVDLFPVNASPFVDAVVLALAAFVLLMTVALAAQQAPGSAFARGTERCRRCAPTRNGSSAARALAPSGTIEIEEGKVILQGEVLFASGSRCAAARGAPVPRARRAEARDAARSGSLANGARGLVTPTTSRAARQRGLHFELDLSTARAFAVTRVLIGAGLT